LRSWVKSAFFTTLISSPTRTTSHVSGALTALLLLEGLLEGFVAANAKPVQSGETKSPTTTRMPRGLIAHLHDLRSKDPMPIFMVTPHPNASKTEVTANTPLA
jgi:hypothetical protein